MDADFNHAGRGHQQASKVGDPNQEKHQKKHTKEEDRFIHHLVSRTPTLSWVCGGRQSSLGHPKPNVEIGCGKQWVEKIKRIASL